jgi:hypothetical protein
LLDEGSRWMNGAEIEVDVQVDRLNCPSPAGIWLTTGPEIDIEALIYYETLSFRIEPRFWTVIVVA